MFKSLLLSFFFFFCMFYLSVLCMFHALRPKAGTSWTPEEYFWSEDILSVSYNILKKMCLTF